MFCIYNTVVATQLRSWFSATFHPIFRSLENLILGSKSLCYLFRRLSWNQWEAICSTFCPTPGVKKDHHGPMLGIRTESWMSFSVGQLNCGASVLACSRPCAWPSAIMHPWNKRKWFYNTSVWHLLLKNGVVPESSFCRKFGLWSIWLINFSNYGQC